MGASAISVIPPLVNAITLVELTKKTKRILPITAKSFSNPHTDFEARRSKAPRSYIYHKLGSAIFLVTLACLDISSKKRWV